MKHNKDYEWSMGNGQCPACEGHNPNGGWWTDMVGHRGKCPLAELMQEAGRNPVWEHLNPERVVGMYDPEKGKPGNHLLCMIRFNDPEKDKKLAIGYRG